MTTEVISAYTANDTRPLLERNYGDGETNITGWSITLRIKRPSQPVLSKLATIVDGPAGDFSFEFAAGDLVAGEGQEAEIEFDDNAGGVFTLADLQFNVREELG
jgi:hypothetical protein